MAPVLVHHLLSLCYNSGLRSQFAFDCQMKNTTVTQNFLTILLQERKTKVMNSKITLSGNSSYNIEAADLP